MQGTEVLQIVMFSSARLEGLAGMSIEAMMRSWWPSVSLLPATLHTWLQFKWTDVFVEQPLVGAPCQVGSGHCRAMGVRGLFFAKSYPASN